jgi:hypothetical protein
MNASPPTVPIWQVIPWWPVLLLAGAAVAFYIASRLGAAALDWRGANPAGAAAAHWLPMAAVTITVLKHYPHAAVSIIFASSVACLTLVPGVTLLGLPRVEPDAPAPVESRESGRHRAWSMVLPTALLALLIGFKSHFTLQHALILIAQGIVTLAVWSAPSAQPSALDPSPPHAAVLVFEILFWIALTLIGAIMAVVGIADVASRVPHLTTGLTGALMIAPALALPMIGAALSSTSRGQADAVISTAVDCVLLNLCVLLPTCIIVWRIVGGPNDPLPYPMASWRLDAVVLVICGAALLITSTRRWIPGRAEGWIALLAFAAYMVANKSLAIR